MKVRELIEKLLEFDMAEDVFLPGEDSLDTVDLVTHKDRSVMEGVHFSSIKE